MLSVEKVGSKQENMARLLRKDWKEVGIAKEMKNDLIRHIQPVITVLKKNPNNRAKTLLDLEKY